ncbi:MAG: monofunctional biosynthetic peptidoglycan transglycosylase [Gracilimonas sp.]|uniref:monofunctional biosynthetic peptidoglycan transglycosylase n=1 Tax=Gracilimonas sp. TaxID=1974203 RepID=UPI003752798B|nr:monofunctional biosynthetic peptidoglycan transglycosylase [Gracilimonas sp.]
MKERTSKSWKKYGQIAGGVLLGWMFWFCLLIILLRWVNPPFTAFTLQENWEELGKERYNLREFWIPDEEIPDHLKLALVASEDQRFYEHWGLDLAAIEEAIEEREQSGRVRGASTITQQVAKNLFLSPAQSYIRKGLEAGIALLIELFWTKDRIMEVYLNIAEFGRGMFGISTASDHYYGKPASALTPKESARMMTVLPNPKIIEPEPPSDYVLNRSNWILRNMEQLSGLRFTPKQYPPQDSVAFFPDTVENTGLTIANDSSFADTLSLGGLDSTLIDSLTDTLFFQQ